MKNIKNYLLAGLILAIISISVGFATLNGNVNITGTATAKGNSWGIAVLNIGNEAGVTPTVAPRITGTTVSYSATLEKPNDYYEFQVDIKNAGTIPAKLSAVPTKTGSSSYMTQTVTYSTGTAIGANDTWDANETKRVKVRVAYNDITNKEDLPTADSATTFGVTFNFVQA